MRNAIRARQPWPDFGGRIVKVHNMEDWQTLLERAHSIGACVLVDCYALWCPPCRSAAPVFARMSEEYTQETVIFAKVDVDEAADVSSELQITAMPTFKLIGPDGEVGMTRGWSEDGVRRLLARGGAQREAHPPGDASEERARLNP